MATCSQQLQWPSEIGAQTAPGLSLYMYSRAYMTQQRKLDVRYVDYETHIFRARNTVDNINARKVNCRHVIAT